MFIRIFLSFFWCLVFLTNQPIVFWENRVFHAFIYKSVRCFFEKDKKNRLSHPVICERCLYHMHTYIHSRMYDVRTLYMWVYVVRIMCVFFFLSCSSDNLAIENHLELESVHSTADNIYYMRVFSRIPHVCVLFSFSYTVL